MQDREIVKFKIEHLDIMDIMPSSVPIDRDRIKLISSVTPAYTLFADSEPIVCGGVVPQVPGTLEVWTVPSTFVNRYPISFHKAIKYALETLTGYYSATRIQTTCICENQTSRKWLKKLGFIEEGILRKYCNGQDFYMFGKVI